MSFEPQKFFIGLVDFFSVLMPGAVLAYLGKGSAASALGRPEGFPLDGAESMAVFLFASYLIGHFVFLLGAFLDEWVYDRLRKATRLGQIKRLAEGKQLVPRWIRRAAQTHYLFGENADAAVSKAQRLKALALQPISGGGAINAYQWCKAWLSKEHPEGLLAVQRFEADSKFFRSFVVVLPILAAFFFFKQDWIPSAVCLGLLLPALLRYIDQRFKGTQQAYWLVITLEALKKSSRPEPPDAESGELSRAGGVVFCKRGEIVEYLLVQASKDRAQWVLPKGRIEPGENARTTAVREVLEETGVWARVIRSLDDVTLPNGAETSLTRFYLMEFVEEETRGKEREPAWPEGRRHDWLTLAEAKQKSSFEETRNLFEKAETSRMDSVAAIAPEL